MFYRVVVPAALTLYLIASVISARASNNLFQADFSCREQHYEDFVACFIDAIIGEKQPVRGEFEPMSSYQRRLSAWKASRSNNAMIQVSIKNLQVSSYDMDRRVFPIKLEIVSNPAPRANIAEQYLGNRYASKYFYGYKNWVTWPFFKQTTTYDYGPTATLDGPALDENRSVKVLNLELHVADVDRARWIRENANAAILLFNFRPRSNGHATFTKIVYERKQTSNTKWANKLASEGVNSGGSHGNIGLIREYLHRYQYFEISDVMIEFILFDYVNTAIEWERF